MQKMLLGVVAGLVMGVFGALIYEQSWGEGAQLNKTKSDLESTRAELAKAAEESKSKAGALSDQVRQLTASNDELKHQVEDLKKASASTSLSNANYDASVRAGVERDILLWKSRLNLTPEQEAALRAAIDERIKIQAMMRHGEEIGPQTMANYKAKTIAQVLMDMLNPDQKVAYQQLKDDQKKSQAESTATSSMNRIAPLLNLNEAQKDQVYSALYQMEMDKPSGVALHSADELSAYLDAEAKAKEDALAKILTPDQLAIYHRQAQSQLQMLKANMQQSRQQAAKTGAMVSGAVGP